MSETFSPVAVRHRSGPGSQHRLLESLRSVLTASLIVIVTIFFVLHNFPLPPTVHQISASATEQRERSETNYHDKTLAHFDMSPFSQASAAAAANKQHGSRPYSSDSDAVVIQMTIAIEIVACVVFLMLLLERAQKYAKERRQCTIVEQLEELQRLRANGSITDEEYEEARQRLLKQLSEAQDAALFGNSKSTKRSNSTQTSKASVQDELNVEDPLLANQWPHIRVNVPGSGRSGKGFFGEGKVYWDEWVKKTVNQIALDWDDPAKRAALGLVVALVSIMLAAVLAPITLLKALFVAIAGLAGGTAQDGSSETITIDENSSDKDSYYVGWTVTLTSGAGAGQSRQIIAYDKQRKICTVTPVWGCDPDSTTKYVIIVNPWERSALRKRKGQENLKAKMIPRADAAEGAPDRIQDYVEVVEKGMTASPSQAYSLSDGAPSSEVKDSEERQQRSHPLLYGSIDKESSVSQPATGFNLFARQVLSLVAGIGSLCAWYVMLAASEFFSSTTGLVGTWFFWIFSATYLCTSLFLAILGVRIAIWPQLITSALLLEMGLIGFTLVGVYPPNTWRFEINVLLTALLGTGGCLFENAITFLITMSHEKSSDSHWSTGSSERCGRYGSGILLTAAWVAANSPVFRMDSGYMGLPIFLIGIVIVMCSSLTACLICGRRVLRHSPLRDLPQVLDKLYWFIGAEIMNQAATFAVLPTFLVIISPSESMKVVALLVFVPFEALGCFLGSISAPYALSYLSISAAGWTLAGLTAARMTLLTVGLFAVSVFAASALPLWIFLALASLTHGYTTAILDRTPDWLFDVDGHNLPPRAPASAAGADCSGDGGSETSGDARPPAFAAGGDARPLAPAAGQGREQRYLGTIFMRAARAAGVAVGVSVALAWLKLVMGMTLTAPT